MQRYKPYYTAKEVFFIRIGWGLVGLLAASLSCYLKHGA